MLVALFFPLPAAPCGKYSVFGFFLRSLFLEMPDLPLSPLLLQAALRRLDFWNWCFPSSSFLLESSRVLGGFFNQHLSPPPLFPPLCPAQGRVGVSRIPPFRVFPASAAQETFFSSCPFWRAAHGPVFFPFSTLILCPRSLPRLTGNTDFWRSQGEGFG